tara:strand:- start:1191 stop:2921 length:1731 start_codon:yes stop_codon:yes gene_type:complete
MENLKKLWSILPERLKPRFVILIFLSLVGTVLEMIGITLIIPMMSTLTGENDLISAFSNKFGYEISENFLSIESLLKIFFVIIFLKISVLIFIIYYQNNFVFSFFTEVLVKLYNKYINKQLSFHLKNNSAELIRNLIGETHNVTVGYMSSVANLFLEIIVVLGLIFIVVYLQPSIALGVLVLITLIGSLIFLLIKKKIAQLGKERQIYNFLDIKYIMQGLGGIKEIKVANKEEELMSIYSSNAKNMKRVNFLISSINQTPKLILEFLAMTTLIFLLFVFTKMNYSFVVIISYFTIILAAFLRLLPSVNKIVFSFMNLTFYTPSLEVLYSELSKIDKENIKQNFLNKDKRFDFKSKIEIKNLEFLHNDGERRVEIFKNAEMTILKGEMIGIIGETGSGKSTLVDLIIGLLKPLQGEIIVDGVNINENLRAWNNIIGYVPQSTYLNDDTIEENIFFYEKLFTRNNNKLFEAIKQSQLKKFISNLPKGLNTTIGEQGLRLSGGQRQRIGIARSIYKDSEILIFDESTNALDKDTEDSFLNDVTLFKGKKTILMISHKLSTLEKCDKIFEVKNRRIIQKK